MSPVHQIEIPVGGTVTLKQGGLHIMLMKPKAETKLGDAVPLVLEFANGETMTFPALVKKKMSNESS